MIGTILALALRFWPVVAAVGAILVGFGLNYWFEVTDWKSAAVFAGALVACAYIAQSDSPLSRMGIAAVLVFAGYLKGGIDRAAVITAEYEQTISELKSTAKRLSDEEVKRQQDANDKAIQEAQKVKEQYDADLQALREENEQLRTEASKDKFADRPGLSLDAVDRLNKRRLRGNQRPTS